MRYSDEELRRMKARRRELVGEYGTKGQHHPMGRMIGGLNPAAQELHRLRGQIAEAEAERRRTTPPRLYPIPGSDQRGHYGLKFDIEHEGRRGRIGTDNHGRWYVVVGEGREAQALEDESGRVATFKTKGEAARAFVKRGRAARDWRRDPDREREIAEGMLRRYSTSRIAAEMAHWHAMDHPEGSEGRRRWLRIRDTILSTGRR